MLAFHFIDSRHVAIPVYTRLFSIKSAAKHLAGYTWGMVYWLPCNSMAEVDILQTGSWMMLSPRLRSTLRQMKVKQKSHRSTVASVKTCFRTPSYTDALMHMEQQESINLCKNFSSQKICSYHSIEKCLNVRPEALQQGRQRLAHQILESLHIRRCYGLIVLI